MTHRGNRAAGTAGGGSGAVLEAPALVAGLDDLAMMGETVEQRGGHLGVAEDGWPFAEGEVGGDDDRGALVEPAHEVEEQLPAGRRRIVRHGHFPEREIQTGIGPVAVRCPRVRDRGAGETGPRVRFTSRILPPYLRRAKSIEELLPWLYLKGISTGDFCAALAALLGPEAPGLSASTIARLKEVWQGELEHWQRRDLSAKRYVYFWADGVYFSPRLDHDKQCMCVIIGADELGRKELLAIADGYRESAQSWREVLLDLKRRGLAIAPELATGDGALGFWKALREVYGTTREQRCWVHKTANVLNKLPKSVQPRAKQHRQDIWMAETRAVAEKAFDFFLEAYGPKYDKAVACLAKDRDVLLAFYDFPAEHWKHIRTTNPIESTALVPPQDHQDQGLPQPHDGAHHGLRCASRPARSGRLDGSHQIADIIQGVKFKDGEKLAIGDAGELEFLRQAFPAGHVRPERGAEQPHGRAA